MDDINKYRDMLRVNKHQLDIELEVQPEVLERISRQIAELNAEIGGFADNVKRAEANSFNEAKEAGESDKRAEMAKHRDPFCEKARRAYQVRKQELEEWQGLYVAWQSKGYSIKELTSLYIAQYFSIDPNHNISRRERPNAAPPRRDFTVDKPATRERKRAVT